MAAAAVRGSGAKIDGDVNSLPSRLRDEAAFLTEKLNKRKYEAFEANHLLQSEVNEELLAGAREFQQRRSKQDREQENERRLKRQKLEAKPLELTALRTKKIYISKRASNDYDQDYLSRQAEKLGATVIQDMVGAGIMVVPDLDPDRLGIKVLWTSMLLGHRLVLPSLLLGRSQAALTFKAAVSFWRRVFITEEFKAKHLDLVDVVTRACASEPSRWPLLSTVDEFNKQFQKAKKDGRPGQVVILKRTKEEVQGVFRGCKVLDFIAFQNSINKVDASQTSPG